MRVEYGFVGDGIATQHYCPFDTDEAFLAVWPAIQAHWQPGIDVRWRVWIMRQLAIQASSLEGSFAEFGTYRGGCASSLLATGCLAPGRSFYLFDTFAGIPDSSLSPADIPRLRGEFSNTTSQLAKDLTDRWDRDNTRYVVGDVHDTLSSVETGPLAFAHLDVNAVEPSALCLAYAYPRLVPGGVLLFDDYGSRDFIAQRLIIDRFAASEAATLIQLPTGTAFLLKPKGDSAWHQ